MVTYLPASVEGIVEFKFRIFNGMAASNVSVDFSDLAPNPVSGIVTPKGHFIVNFSIDENKFPLREMECCEMELKDGKSLRLGIKPGTKWGIGKAQYIVLASTDFEATNDSESYFSLQGHGARISLQSGVGRAFTNDISISFQDG